MRRRGGGGPRKLADGAPRSETAFLASGGEGENLRRGRTIDTLMTAPSSWDSCICAIAASASASLVYRTYAVPRFVITKILALKLSGRRITNIVCSLACQDLEFVHKNQRFLGGALP